MFSQSVNPLVDSRRLHTLVPPKINGCKMQAIQQGKLKAAGEGGQRSTAKQQRQEQPKIGTEEKEKDSAKPDVQVNMEACDPDMELNPEKPETAHEISIPITVDTTGG